MSHRYEVDIETLDKSKLHLKYVVSYHHAQKMFYVNWVRDWKFHSDCNVPSGFRRASAGWLSVPRDEMNQDNYENLMTWGGSVGFDMCPHPRDLAMLKKNLSEGIAYFDKDGNELDEETVTKALAK